jgi:hypothetical protein
MPAIKLPPSPAKEGRYWVFELFIVILVIVGTVTLAWGLPHIFHRSTNWASLFIGAAEVIIGAAVFYMARLNMARVVAIAVFASGAVIFYLALNAVY